MTSTFNWFPIVALLSLIVAACTSGSPQVPVSHENLIALCDEFQIELDPAIAPGRRLQARTPTAPRDGSREGTACVEVTIDTEGKIVDPEVLYTTSPQFARHFLAALKGWRYEPATLDGQPVEMRTVVSATYTID